MVYFFDLENGEARKFFFFVKGPVVFAIVELGPNGGCPAFFCFTILKNHSNQGNQTKNPFCFVFCCFCF